MRVAPRTEPRALALAIGMALLPWAFMSPAHAGTAANTLPTGGQYTYGTGSITEQRDNKLQVTQTTDKGTINWTSFSIGSNAWVNFTQPSASSITLNRVLGNNPSEIFGRMTANGQVFLSNPSGVLFAPSASVDVGALFATTLTVSDQDANAGRYKNWSNPGNSGSVVNQGTIITANGYTALAAPQVRNEGLIVAHAGTVALAAGDRVSLDMIGDGLIKLNVDEATLNASVVNTGRIEADGGSVLLTARSANALLDTVVNNSGVIRANSLVERNGEIVLDGGSAGVVTNTGSLQAAGMDAGTSGGTVKVLGDEVALLNGSSVDVSGDFGGGAALIGGDYQGKNPDVANATSTNVAQDVLINADAVRVGSGGKVIVWSNEITRYAGHISARGGVQSGNGGSVEVSGKHGLAMAGLVGHFDLSAQNGRSGELLLDPNVINVNASATSDPCLSTGTCTASGITTLNLKASDIRAFLTSSAGNNLTLKTNDSGGAGDNININTTLTTTNARGNKLTLDADDVVTGFANIVGTAGTHFTVLLKIDLTGSVSKTYDGNNIATLTSGNYIAHGFISGDAISSVNETSGTYDTRNASTGKLVTSATLTQGVDYTFLAGSAANYTVPSNATRNVGTINKAPLTVTAQTDTKTYDGTTSSSVGPVITFGALQTGDTTTTFSQTFDTRNAGTNKTVTAGGAVNDGNGGNNYSYSFMANSTGVINARALTVTAQTDMKTYDGTTNSSVAPLITSGVLQTGDTTTTFSQTFDTRNAGTNKALMASGVVNDGNGGDNYSYTFAADSTGVINQRSVTLAAPSVTKTYDGTTGYTTTGADLTAIGLPLVGGDTVSTATISYANRNAGANKPVTLDAATVNDGNGGANYSVTLAGNSTSTINKAPLTVTAQTDTKTYDGTTSSSVAPVITFGALQTGDTTATLGQTFDTKDVGMAKMLTASGMVNDGNGGNNYAVTLIANTSGVITQLGSVAWTGAGGNSLWSNAANWAGNAIPDKANVANVNLSGATVTFDNTVPKLAGSVQITSLSNGTLAINNSTLSVASDLNLAGYTQTGGAISTGGTFKVTNNFGQTGGMITSTGAVNITQASGAVGFRNIVGSNTVAVTANSSTGDITLASGGGLSGTTLVLTAGKNVSLNSAISGTNVDINFGQQVAGTFTPAVSITGTTTVDGGVNQDLFDFSGAPAITATLAGGGGTDTLKQSGGKIWNLHSATQNSGMSGALTCSGIANLTDTGNATFNMGTGGSVSGNLTGSAGSINYGSYGSTVAFSASNAAGASTGIGGTWSGISAVAGSAGSDTVTGTGVAYSAFDATTKGTFRAGGVNFTGLENINDFGPATVNMTGTTTGGLAGNVTAVGGTVTLGGGNQVGGNVNMNNAGTLNMGTAGTVTGSVNTATLSYASYSTSVTFDLNGGASTGMAKSTGTTLVTGSSAATDTIKGSGQTYTITGLNAANNGTLLWTSFEKLTDLATGTLRATNATWTLNGSNTGTVTNLSGTFSGMGNLIDLGTGTFNMHGTGNGSITGNLNGGTNGSVNYAGYSAPVTFNLAGAATGMGSWSNIKSVSGSGGSDTIAGSGATYNLTAQNGGNSGSLNWTSFENVSDATGGVFNLFVASNNVTGTISSGGSGPATCAVLNSAACANLNSNVDITMLDVSVGGMLLLTGNANSWNLTGAPLPSGFGASNANANVFFNGACVGGPACGTVITIIGSIGGTVTQIANQALQDALDTDSVQKQIDYGFAGDVGTTPPMDHRIDETGISTPECFEESREGEPCRD
jgi:filamentous hemagglutinin family protein